MRKLRFLFALAMLLSVFAVGYQPSAQAPEGDDCCNFGVQGRWVTEQTQCTCKAPACPPVGD
jgi:hypothetical protein